MKYIIALMATLTLPASAQVCGVYQVEDFGGRILYTVTHFSQTQTGLGQTVYTITNPGHPVIPNMIRGMCYCVSGSIQQDPEFAGDVNYQLLNVMRVEGVAYNGCLPGEPSFAALPAK